MKNINRYGSFVFKHFYIILIITVLCSIGGYAEKKYVNPLFPKTGRVTLTQNVKIDFADSNANEAAYSSDITTLNPYLGTWAYAQSFIENTQSGFDYSQFDKNWAKLSEVKKYDWLNKHLHANYLGHNVYEFVFQLQEHDAKSLEYIEKNGRDLLNEYIQFSTASYSDNVFPIKNVTMGRQYELHEDSDDDPLQNVPRNFAISGAILGFFSGLAILTVYYKVKQQ
ncbi:MAG: hypothetical protein ACFWT7_00265 [Succiniclasticum sp.]|jgi:hypothetical protein